MALPLLSDAAASLVFFGGGGGGPGIAGIVVNWLAWLCAYGSRLGPCPKAQSVSLCGHKAYK